MKCADLLTVLSECGWGAAMVGKDHCIWQINETGVRLLHGGGSMRGLPFPDQADALLDPDVKEPFICLRFGEYLTRCDGPEPEDLPPDARWVIFRDATDDYFLAMMRSVVEHIKEGVVMCDGESRLNFFNGPAIKQDSLVAKDVLGENVNDVYRMNDGKNCLLPETVKSRKPTLNERHRYTTRFGKSVDTMANTYPVLKSGQVLGAFNIVEDWSTVSDLHRQIIDLQERLVASRGSEKAKRPKALGARFTFDDIVYNSAAMRRVVSQSRQIARTDAAVMIYGETGTGKELIAQSIHNASLRAEGPFLAINCAALPENLLESLLFGSVKGAYTGAENRPGLFEQANHGTLLLDEINSMDISLQAKLLRVLQDGVLRRVGSETETHIDVRVLTCINVPPLQAIAENRLRRDLFYRLGVVNIELPPLRDREDDIALLTQYFILRFNAKNHREIRGLDTATAEIFNQYDWPGNVRELQHAIEQAMILLPQDQMMITVDYISPHILSDSRPHPEAAPRPAAVTAESLSDRLKDIERDTLVRVLTENRGNITRAAKALDMSRQNLQYRIKRYQIDIRSLRSKRSSER